MMITSNKMLAAFLATNKVSVTALEDGTYQCEIPSDDPIVDLFYAETGYNVNIHQLEGFYTDL